MAEGEERKKVPLVPENLLKKRKAYQALRAIQAKQALLEKKERKGKEFRFKWLDSFLHDSWRQQRDVAGARHLEGNLVLQCLVSIPWPLLCIQSVRKMPHTAHKGGSRDVPLSKSLISKLAGSPLLLAGLALSSIWEKARARDGQREVVGDKGQWALFCKG
jgi:hypothetical protein